MSLLTHEPADSEESYVYRNEVRGRELETKIPQLHHDIVKLIQSESGSRTRGHVSECIDSDAHIIPLFL